MEKNTTRRELLRTTGLALAGTTALSGNALASDVDPRPEPLSGHLANEDLDWDPVSPYFDYDEAEAGNWISHEFGWVVPVPIDEGGDGLIREWVAQTDMVVEIAGERIDDPDQYWQEPEPAVGNEDHTRMHWEYRTPPRPVGEYYFEWQSYVDGEPTYPAFPRGQHYTVTPGRSSDD